MPKTDSNLKTVGLKPQKWCDINWKTIEKKVFKLQKRIFQASSQGDVKTVRKLQKTLIKSWSARLFAVRRVSQDNQGKKTAGVDGVKSLSPVARFKLANQLKPGDKVAPTRRVWIPKPGKDEKRPLGIPTMYDRALQALVKLALEPEWEAKFEPNSYGFRPGRSCYDAREAIFNAIKQKAKYVLDADIAQCFDRINHEKLLEKLNTYPTLRKQIRAWLKAGYMDKDELFPSNEGTPQGGVISPLLANIALHGMEITLMDFAKTWKGRKRANVFSLSFIRYADDFVVIHESLDVIKKCKIILMEWLKDMGLELKPSKTRICHTINDPILNTQSSEITYKGFDFLGFYIRQYPVGKYQSGKSPHGQSLGFKTLIKPSKEKVKAHYQKLCEVIDRHKGQKQEILIKALNPIIKGWCNYYSVTVAKEVFSKLDNLLYWKLMKWGIKRHPNKTKKFVVKKYFHTIGDNNWRFASRTKEGNLFPLIFHSETPIVRHIKVKGNASPYDGNSLYWSTRMGRNPDMSKRTATLLKRQKGKCTHCGLNFKYGDIMETDHKKTLKLGGSRGIENLQLLHRHCHDKKTRVDGSLNVHKNSGNSLWPIPDNYKWVEDTLILMY